MALFLSLYSGVVVYFTTVSGSETLVSNGGMINEWWIGKDVEESGLGLFRCIIPSFVCRNEEKPRNLCQGGQCRRLDSLADLISSLGLVGHDCHTPLMWSLCLLLFIISLFAFIFPSVFLFTCRMFVLTAMVLCHFYYPILYVLFHPCIETITAVSDIGIRMIFFLILQFFIRLRISLKLIEVRKTHLLFIWISIRSEAMK